MLHEIEYEIIDGLLMGPCDRSKYDTISLFVNDKYYFKLTPDSFVLDIGKGDKGLMQAIQESMFVFDMLIMSDDKSLQTLLRMVDTDLLVLALKGADEPLQEKLFGCMSKRAAANIMDEMEGYSVDQVLAATASHETDATLVMIGDAHQRLSFNNPKYSPVP